MFGKTIRVKLPTSNYCETKNANFHITNYNSDKLKNLPIMSTSHDGIEHNMTIIGKIIKFDDKRQKYLCEFNLSLLNILGLTKTDIKNLQIGLSIRIKNNVPMSDIDLNNDGVELVKGFLITKFPKYNTVGVYCNKYNEYDKNVFIDNGIGLIELNDTIDYLTNQAKNFIDSSHGETSLRNLINKCDKIVIIHNSDIVDVINHTNNYDLLTINSRLIAFHSFELDIPVYLAKSYDPLNGKLLQKRVISQ